MEEDLNELEVEVICLECTQKLGFVATFKTNFGSHRDDGKWICPRCEQGVIILTQSALNNYVFERLYRVSNFAKELPENFLVSKFLLYEEPYLEV